MTEDSDAWVGQTLAGKYRVEKVLGKGGMGVVVGARHIKLDEPVAIKLLRPAMMEVEGMVSRFLREARAASKIKSPNVVRVTDVDVLPDGVPYMVMEHLTGVDFFDLRAERGALGVTEAVGYVVQACDAIAEAHALGIVHRDLKPSNLFLHRRTDGREIVKVLDFGLSKVEAQSEMEATRSGQVLGSPKYMSPEQMLSMHDVDRRADVWSLGVILYEMVTGQPPFVGDTTPQLCAQVLNIEPRPPSALRPGLPTAVDALILRCLQKDRSKRFADVAELVAALMPFAPADALLRRTISTTRMAAVTATMVSPPSSTKLRSMTPAPVTVGAPSRPPLEAYHDLGDAAAGGAGAAGGVPDDKPTEILGRKPVSIADNLVLDDLSPPSPPANAAPFASKGRARLAAALGGVALLVVLGVLYATQSSGDDGGSRPSPSAQPATAAAAPPPTTPPAPPHPAHEASPPLAPALRADDLPDANAAVPSGAPKALAPSGAGPVAKKARGEPKPEPSADPFGGRRR